MNYQKDGSSAFLFFHFPNKHKKSPASFDAEDLVCLINSLFASERHQSYATSAFDCSGQLTLMFSAGAGNTTGQNFAAFGNITAQFSNILVIDFFNFINAEAANFSSGSSTSFAFHFITSLKLEWNLLIKGNRRTEAAFKICRFTSVSRCTATRKITSTFNELKAIGNNFGYPTFRAIFCIIATDL